MNTIYDFIADPFKAVRAGYRPTYMTCVSAVSHTWWLFAKLAFESCAEFRDILDMTLKEIFATFLHSVFWILATLTFPIGIWFWGWIQYLNVQHAIKIHDKLR